MNLEELQRENQASIARLLKRATVRKLLGEGQRWTADRSVEKGEHTTERSPSQVKLQKENIVPNITNSGGKKGKSVKLQLERKMHKIITKISDLRIFQGGENITGTLEAHVDGFRYTISSSPCFHVEFRYDNVKNAFYQVGDDRTPPLLHFRLRHCIKVWTEKTKDIQFHLVSTPTSSSEIEKDGQSTDSSDDLNTFVHKVESKWRIGVPFQEVEKEFEFHGVYPSKESGVFALTFSTLVGLVEEPFIVVPLDTVELVYLEQVSPREIDMTVVFEDFDRQVLQINSIPLNSVANIKFCLDVGNVKYYENDKKQDWESIMEGIKQFPQDFINKGGWEILDPNASAGYEAESSSEEDDDVYE